MAFTGTIRGCKCTQRTAATSICLSGHNAKNAAYCSKSITRVSTPDTTRGCSVPSHKCLLGEGGAFASFPARGRRGTHRSYITSQGQSCHRNSRPTVNTRIKEFSRSRHGAQGGIEFRSCANSFRSRQLSNILPFIAGRAKLNPNPSSALDNLCRSRRTYTMSVQQP